MSLDAAREYLAFPHLEQDLRSELEAILGAAEGGDAAAGAELHDRFMEPLAFGTILDIPIFPKEYVSSGNNWTIAIMAPVSMPAGESHTM